VGYVVLDTDVASLAFRRRLPPGLEGRLLGHVWCVTFVTVGEMVTWAEVRSWGQRNRGALDRWLDQRVIIDSSREVSYLWGRLNGDSRRAGRPRPVNDTWIAACALVEGLPLATANVKDYADLVDSHGLDLLTAAVSET
jgi:hypothetical protein